MKKTKIEWCDSTWNPVTGCLHECEYCYAKKITHRFGGSIETAPDRRLHILSEPFYADKTGQVSGNRFCAYPYMFDPTFHKYRLDEPIKWRSPQNIFVCSMADLFGDWIPDEWIQEVFKACEAAPQHQYLFLTKNGQRYKQLGLLPDNNNFWYGTTRTGINPRFECGASDHGHTFLSLEPLLAPIDAATLNALEFWDWVIIGAETGNRRNKVIPQKTWIDDIVNECKKNKTPVFMKDSLSEIVGEHNMLREFPTSLIKAGDEKLNTHLKENNLLPDEYFLL